MIYAATDIDGDRYVVELKPVVADRPVVQLSHRFPFQAAALSFLHRLTQTPLIPRHPLLNVTDFLRRPSEPHRRRCPALIGAYL